MRGLYHKNKKLIFIVLWVWTVLILLFLTISINKLVQSGRFANQLLNDDNSGVLTGWGNDTVRNYYKEKWWLEQQVELAKSDSFSLGINLKDSSLQVQLKGTVLLQAKILKHKPEQFFTNANEKVYQMIFVERSRINSSIANIPKKPIRKVIAPKVGAEVQDNKLDSVKENQLNWHFLTNQGVEVIINGVLQSSDSTNFRIPTYSTMMDYRLAEVFNNPFKHKKTIPLFLWINDQDAKAIYRALSDKPRVIFRD